jgi:hydroxylaminobenzene mutase
MNGSRILSRQGRRLLQIGLVMLLFLSLEGFVIPEFAAPQLGLAARKLAGLQSVLLLALGLLWPRLSLGIAAARIAFWCLVYSAVAILAAYVLGAVWGAGDETMRQAAGGAHGSALQETAILALAYSSPPTGLVAFALVRWGLRGEEV